MLPPQLDQIAAGSAENGYGIDGEGGGVAGAFDLILVRWVSGSRAWYEQAMCISASLTVYMHGLIRVWGWEGGDLEIAVRWGREGLFIYI